MPVEGRSLSSRRTQQVVRNPEIGQPINSPKCSETADGVTRESEGRSRPPLLRAVPRISREDILSLAWAQCRSNERCTGLGWAGLRDRGAVRCAAAVRRTGVCAHGNSGAAESRATQLDEL